MQQNECIQSFLILTYLLNHKEMILKKNIYLIRLLALKQTIHNPGWAHTEIKQTLLSKLLIVFICTQQD